MDNEKSGSINKIILFHPHDNVENLPNEEEEFSIAKKPQIEAEKAQLKRVTVQKKAQKIK